MPASVSQVTAADDLTTANTRTGPKVENQVGGPHRVFIMLDDQQRIALIAESFRGIDQAIIVSRVQADGRFIQYVQHTDQSRTNLACQANSLRFTT